MTTSRSNATLIAWNRVLSRWDFAVHIDGDGWSLHRQMIAGKQWDVRAEFDVPTWARAIAAEAMRRAAEATASLNRPCRASDLVDVEQRLLAIMADYPIATWSAVVHAEISVTLEERQ